MASARVFVLLVLPALAAAHGGLIYPMARNSRDGELDGFAGKFVCNTPANDSTVGMRATGNGQPCFWFSQGCTIGCETCDNHTQHTLGKSLCNSTMEPTLPYYAWTMNRWAKEGTVNDTYRYHPWRAPGSAPVIDACGMAGGRHSSDPGGGDAEFIATPWAKMGDLGSQVLLKGPPSADWTAGSTVEVAWGIRFNHGGGYQYRLCPASEPLTEACFQKYPLNFSGNPILRWNNGSQLEINGTFVSTGTQPPGSTWQMNPIPRIDFDSKSSGQPPGWSGCDMPARGLACRQFDPPCKEQLWDGIPWHGTNDPHDHRNVDVQGDCSGDLTLASIVDHVVIPKDLPAGDYVLGFRWDCEETAQIWSSCADVNILGA
eukprot:m.287891 g.287891  ORF g.287891 m.287891 type:complete len:373 (-) comp16368_c0_seq18:199-1317(-)